MIAAVEKQKFVYVLNRDQPGNLTISSPLEAHKSHTIVFTVCALDQGYDNPIFAAIELDYADADQASPRCKTWETRMNIYSIILLGCYHFFEWFWLFSDHCKDPFTTLLLFDICCACQLAGKPEFRSNFQTFKPQYVMPLLIHHQTGNYAAASTSSKSWISKTIQKLPWKMLLLLVSCRIVPKYAIA